MRSSVYILLLLGLLACNKEEGFIPKLDKDDPFYSEHTPTQEWSVQASIDDHTYSVIEGEPQIVGDLVLVMIRAKDQLKAYDYTDGNLVWELNAESYFGGHVPDNYSILDRSGILYVIDRETGAYLSLSKENGQVLSAQDPKELGLNLKYDFKAIIIDDHFYKRNYIGPGTSSIIKYNFLDNTYETICTIDGYEELDEFSDAHYDVSEGRLYFMGTLNRVNKGTFSVDLNTGEYDIIWQGNQDYIFTDLYHLTEKFLILADLWGEILAVSKKSGNVVWKFKNQNIGPIDKVLTREDKIYINGNNLVISLNHHSGALNWTLSGPEFHHRAKLFEHKEILIAANNTAHSSTLELYDLRDGQTLIELQMPDDQYVRSFTHDEENGTVIIASGYHLYKYSNLLP